MFLFIFINWLGVDFIKVGPRARIIEIALSIYALRLRTTFKKLFTGANVGRRAQKIGAGCKTVYEINPWLQCLYVCCGW